MQTLALGCTMHTSLQTERSVLFTGKNCEGWTAVTLETSRRRGEETREPARWCLSSCLQPVISELSQLECGRSGNCWRGPQKFSGGNHSPILITVFLLRSLVSDGFAQQSVVPGFAVDCCWFRVRDVFTHEEIQHCSWLVHGIAV